jgi:hypothetical protein
MDDVNLQKGANCYWTYPTSQEIGSGCVRSPAKYWAPRAISAMISS